TGFQKMEGFVESELGTDLDFDESPDHLLNRILVPLRGDYRDENDWRVRVTPRRKRFKTGRSQCSRKSIVDLQIPRFRGWQASPRRKPSKELSLGQKVEFKQIEL